MAKLNPNELSGDVLKAYKSIQALKNSDNEIKRKKGIEAEKKLEQMVEKAKAKRTSTPIKKDEPKKVVDKPKATTPKKPKQTTPKAQKPKEKVKKKVKPKATRRKKPTPKPRAKNKENFMARSSKLRDKEGITWAEAKAKVKKLIAEEKKQEQENAKTELQKLNKLINSKDFQLELNKFPKNSKAPRKYNSTISKDAKIKAKPPGKRISKSGKVYYEYRDNRSDIRTTFPYLEDGGTLPTPFGQAGLVGETGTLNEVDLFAMGGDLPQGVHQYYANTYNAAYPTPHGYAKGGKINNVNAVHIKDNMSLLNASKKYSNVKMDKPPLGSLVGQTYVMIDGKKQNLFVGDKYLAKNNQIIEVYKPSKGLYMRMESGGYIAKYQGKSLDVQAKSLYEAKQKAIKELKVPKSKQGKLSIMSKDAYDNEEFRFMAKGGEVNEAYIDYMNKDKGFKTDRKYFKTYEDAEKWARNEFERFNPDMISYTEYETPLRSFAKGGEIDEYVAITLKPKKSAYKGGKGEVYKNMQTFYDTINAKENEDKYDFIHSLFISDSRKSDPQDISEIKVYMIGEKSGFDDVEKKGLYDLFDLVKTKEEVKDYAKGGKIGFDGLSKKVAKRYVGKPVPKRFQEEYGKTYSKEEAKEVGDKVAAKVYRQQQNMASGGVTDLSENSLDAITYARGGISKYNNKYKMEKGGKVGYDYVPQKAIDELSFTMDKVTKTVSGDEVLSGAYVKSKSKAKVKSSKTSKSNLTQLIIEKADQEDAIDLVLDKDVKEMQKYVSDELVMAFYIGAPKTYDFQGDYSYSGGALSMADEYLKKEIKSTISNLKKNKFEMGLKYPNYDFEKFLGKPKEKQIKGKKFDWVDGETRQYVYKLWIWKDCVIGETIGVESSKDGFIDYTYGKDLSLQGGYKSVQTSKSSKLESIIKFMAKDKNGYVKDNDILYNGLGGATFEDLDKNKIKYESGGTLPTPFGQAGLVGETGTLNELDLFAMGGDLPQGVHQYYANTYNPAYPTPHGYAKGGEVADINKFKKQLIAKAKRKGLYENFGQAEVRKLEDKYGYSNKVREFDNWAMNFDLSQMAKGGKTKSSDINFDKWRRVYNGKPFANKVVLLIDVYGNKKRYVIKFIYKETIKGDKIRLTESLIGGESGSGTSFAVSNMQNKPLKLFSGEDTFEFGSEDEFNRFLESGTKGLNSAFEFFLGGTDIDTELRDWFETGTYSIIKIEPARMFDTYAKGGYIEDEKIIPLNEVRKNPKLKRAFIQGYYLAVFEKGKETAIGVIKTPNEIIDGRHLGNVYAEKLKNGKIKIKFGKEYYAKGGEVDDLRASKEMIEKEIQQLQIRRPNALTDLERFRIDKKIRQNKEILKNRGNYAKGGKTQGYNDKLDESLGNTKGKRSTKEQNYKDRRNESEAMEKKGGKRKYARVKTMDKGTRKKRKTPMTLAKEIRKEGEAWKDAVKRAATMMRK